MNRVELIDFILEVIFVLVLIAFGVAYTIHALY